MTECAICRQPGEEFCSDSLACNFRARRRLGMPLHACWEWQARDHEQIAAVIRRQADDHDQAAARSRDKATAIETAPPPERDAAYRRHIASSEWQTFRDEQKLLAGYLCEWPSCRAPDPALEVHHLDYARLGRERPQDVLVLCPICHRDLDDLRRRGLVPKVEVRLAYHRRVVNVLEGEWIQKRTAWA